ncbi:sirohydrochlorin cobaltochelatase [Pseudomaricurvus alkylphenolicus]|jgi:sirohydrochlorin ferrochelatase|uniref:sirohydrochlorin chelatase n=1 Tax=Pseudomaricurvus alkylphenolicus TaxID=1306991 RepID=UPI00141FA34B|nr:CbiX/SirB N-terminal domain-containing protein [Pseudomaricurvus alkylphenolicus]NIB43972.1 sirohydrochlorin cobaltochelatase [Pseudomaricurvus alkylphenolicus]
MNPQHRALIIMAHGSRRDSANQEFFALVETIDHTSDDYDHCRPALLEQAPPTLLQACQALPEHIEAIDVYPLFFNCGRHVEKDIPQQVAEVMEAMPEKNIRLLEYFGRSQGLADLVLGHIFAQKD